MPDKLKEKLNRAEHAQALLNDALFTDSWAAVERGIHEMWANSKSDEDDKREALYRQLFGLKAVRAQLERCINEGKLAEKELEHQKHGN